MTIDNFLKIANWKLFVTKLRSSSVPIARGLYLFPYRTQQSSLSAVTILGSSSPGKIARCRLYKNSPKGEFLFGQNYFDEQIECGKYEIRFYISLFMLVFLS